MSDKKQSPPSPSLSDMEFDRTELASAPTQSDIVLTSEAREVRSLRLTRYLPPPDLAEAFIGPLHESLEATISLIKRECPSLRQTPPGDISLKLRFDGDTQRSVRNVLFRVLPDAWPGAVSKTLPLVYVDVKRSLPPIPPAPPVHLLSSLTLTHKTSQIPPETNEKKEKTWDDLKREGALLGVQGWSDRAAPAIPARAPSRSTPPRESV